MGDVFMKLVVKVLVVVVGLVVVGVLGFVYHLNANFPDVGPAPDIQVAGTPEQIARGRYLANHVTVCIDCHSTRDWEHFAAPPLPGTEGKGGEVFPEEAGFPGTLIAPNITPVALGAWTDGEIVRAFVSGVNKREDPLFPLMPYPAYRNLMQEDAHAIVAYLRTLKPIDHMPARSSLVFPMTLIVRTIPEPYIPPQPVDGTDSAVYGKYLASIAGCAICHTPQEQGQPIEGMAFAGGFQFPLPGGTVVQSANITPDVETGIGHWQRQFFIGRFKQFAQEGATQITLQNGQNTVMPWTMYAGMTEEDLGAVYDYLKTVTPIRHAVNRFAE
jgi:mono/diheme cytochrome c family protein